MKKIAINGYGRIGRAFLRSYYLRFAELKDKFEIVKINQPATPSAIAYLTEFDSLFGKFAKKVNFDSENLIIEDKKIQLMNLDATCASEELDWSDIDIVLESTGSFSDIKTAQKYLQRGAKKLLFAQPATKEVDATIIFGVNHKEILPEFKIISAASCTTNCLIPILKILQKAYKINSLSATTLHSYMSDQKFIDSFLDTNEEIKMRSAQSIIPIKTQLALGVERIIPELKGKIIANHIRVPALGASGMEICVNLEPLLKISQNLGLDLSAESIKNLFLESANQDFKGVVAVNARNLVSVDFLGNTNSAIIDLNSIEMTENQLRLFVWFDSETGFTNRLLDLITIL